MAETKILNLASFEDVETLKQTTKSQGEEISQVKQDLGDFRDVSGILCSSNLINADNSKYHYELSLSDGTEKRNSGDYSIHT
jgi:hypothetical protein